MYNMSYIFSIFSYYKVIQYHKIIIKKHGYYFEGRRNTANAIQLEYAVYYCFARHVFASYNTASTNEDEYFVKT